MVADNPDGLELLREHLGQDLSELQEACTRMLDPFLSPDGWSGTKLVWNPNASDTELIACLKDIIDAMGAAMGSTLKWKGTVVSKGDESLSVSSRRSSMFSLVSRRKPAAQASALHLICCTDDALNEARVLQTELAMGLDRLVSTSAPERQRKRINGGVRPAIARGGTGSLQHEALKSHFRLNDERFNTYALVRAEVKSYFQSGAYATTATGAVPMDVDAVQKEKAAAARREQEAVDA